MSLLALIVLSQTVTPKAVFDRYAAFRLAHPVITVDWSVVRGSKDVAHGTLALDGIKRMLFKATNGTFSYSLSETELGGIELVPGTQVYDEFPAQPVIVAPTSRVGQQSSFIPMVLLRTQIFSPRINYKMEPSLTVGGVTADVVSWEVKAQSGQLKFEVAVDPEGRIVQFSRVAEQGAMGPMGGPPMGRVRAASPQAATPPEVSAGKAPSVQPGGEIAASKITWTISNYRWSPRATLANYYTPLPKGYVPYAIPPASQINLEVDQTFPSALWSARGKMVDLKAVDAGKPTLVLITSPDSVPSQEAISYAGSLRSGIPNAKVEVVSLARTAAAAKGLPFDVTGKASAAIGDTSTPLFVLFDGAGKITNLWTGFDSSAKSQFVKEVQVAVKTVLDTPAVSATNRNRPKPSSAG